MGKKKPGPFSGQQNASSSSTFTNFPTFFLVKRSSTSNENFHTVSPFLVEKAIIATVSEVKTTKKLRSGDLLVEVHSRKQSQQIVKLKTFSNIPITVSPHASLNSSKGVITCGELLNVPTEEILKELQGQGVSHVRRISIRRDGQLLNTKHLILTFDSLCCLSPATTTLTASKNIRSILHSSFICPEAPRVFSNTSGLPSETI
ncbi:hypothetical protein AVEN_100298-1 [Araneus ventricosus]|uniref:Uncharacterized protein n=1 Tax=Araneus ventricosus TaxID=182803 RepID=A0A4Y2X9Y2_ARAVE|nr:hypothetical protein AVEN_100298-1 [Araneus ventricosus]